MKKLLFISLFISQVYADCGAVGSISERIKDCKFQKQSEHFVVTRLGSKVVLYNKKEDILITSLGKNNKCIKPYKKKEKGCRLKNASRFHLVKVY